MRCLSLSDPDRSISSLFRARVIKHSITMRSTLIKRHAFIHHNKRKQYPQIPISSKSNCSPLNCFSRLCVWGGVIVVMPDALMPACHQSVNILYREHISWLSFKLQIYHSRKLAHATMVL